jgi:hypothetical protein
MRDYNLYSCGVAKLPPNLSIGNKVGFRDTEIQREREVLRMGSLRPWNNRGICNMTTVLNVKGVFVGSRKFSVL